MWDRHIARMWDRHIAKMWDQLFYLAGYPMMWDAIHRWDRHIARMWDRHIARLWDRHITRNYKSRGLVGNSSRSNECTFQSTTNPRNQTPHQPGIHPFEPFPNPRTNGGPQYFQFFKRIILQERKGNKIQISA